MAKRYERVSGCLSREDADRLWHDLIKYRKATRQTEGFARLKYGAGYAIYKVIETPQEGSS